VRVGSNGYRLYGEAEVDRLQQILFYRELGVPLGDIRKILSAPDYDDTEALEHHLAALTARRERIEALIANVKKTLQARKGELTMTDGEIFDGLGQNLVEEIEKRYGEEIRRRYGPDAVEKASAKVRGMRREDYAEAERLRCEAESALREALAAGDPAGPAAQRACELHRQWLCRYTDGYSKEYHKALARLYVEDPRFTAYYDNIAPGCAAFLHDALIFYCQSQEEGRT
jgi:DNA-binding transcriptional MerR regulator